MGNQQGTRLGDVADDAVNSNSVRSSGQNTSSAPLSFHPIHGTCIRLSADMMQADRFQSFCNGLCFSSRPVAMGERVFIRCLRNSEAWSGSIRIGFTTWDPSNFDSSLLPKYSCPDLANHSGFWVKALPENTLTKQNEELCFYFNKVGTVFTGMNSEAMVPLICGLETTKPLWAIVDVYGNTVSVSIRSEMRKNGSTKIKHQSSSSREGLPPEVLRLSNVDGNDAIIPTTTTHRPSFDATMPSHVGLPPARSNSIPLQTVVNNSAKISQKVPPLPPLSHFHSLAIIRNLSFTNQLIGKNADLAHENAVAVRKSGEFCNAYVFTSRPIPLGTKVALQIVSVTSEYRGGLTFGITAADLRSVSRDVLPNNSDDLLDRSEYWVVNKDVVANPQKGDELLFSFAPPGVIQISRNNQPPSTLMYVDGSLSLTFFFDLYGSVECLRLLGTVDSSHPTQVSLPPVTMRTEVASLPPSRPSPEKPLVEQLLLQDPASTNNFKLPAPLIPVPAAAPPRPPPPIPARPDKVALNRTTQKSLHSPHDQYLAPTKSPAESSGFHSSVSPSTPSDSIIMSPSAAVIDAFRQNAQNQLNNGKSNSETSANGEDILSNECTVCLAAQVDCALYSCGHLCLCFSCAMNVRKADNLCPICRDPIKDVIKVFKC